MKMQYFNIQVASKLSGVTSATIRAWEKRYSAVSPARALNKHRLYSNHDIEKLAVLARLTEIGQNIGKIAHLSLSTLRESYSDLLQKPYAEVKFPVINTELEFSTFQQNCLLALKVKKFNIIGRELEKVLLSSSPQDVCRNYIIPLLKEVHSQVLKNNLLKCHEETIKNDLYFFLGKLIWNQVDKSENQEKVILIYHQRSDLLPLMVGIYLIGVQKTPYFFSTENSLEEFNELVEVIGPSTIYLPLEFKYRAHIQELIMKQIILPEDLDLFLYFLDEI